jgi:uncharacterized protein YdcH (DUF465 family)
VKAFQSGIVPYLDLAKQYHRQLINLPIHPNKAFINAIGQGGGIIPGEGLLLVACIQIAREEARNLHAMKIYDGAKNIVSKRFIGFAVNYFMDDPRIVELLTEMLQEQKQTNVRLDRLENGQSQTNTRLERLEKQQQNTNLKLQELTHSNLKLADELHNFMQLGARVVRLEAAVFH